MKPPKKVKIPSKILICNVEYTIKMVDGLSNLTNNLGVCDFDTAEILLDTGLEQNPNRLIQVLWHELSHSFAFESGLADFMHDDALEMFSQMNANFITTLLECDFKKQWLT